MELANNQPELPLLQSPACDIIMINGRCTLRREGEARMVCVAGSAMHHWMAGDPMAERYAMVSLVQSGYADQNDIAWAFGITTRTLRKYQRDYEIGGIAALGRTSGRPPGIQAEPSPWVRIAIVMKSNGFSIRDTAQRLKVSIGAVSKWLTRQRKSIMPYSQTTQTSSSPDIFSYGKKAIAISSITHGKAEGWSLDVDPINRALDRLLARLGKLDDAQPLFAPGQRIAHAGVLLAVPALVQSGIF